MKSIRQQIILFILLIILPFGIILGGISCYLNYATANSLLEQSMTALAVESAAGISNNIKIMQNQAAQAGMNAQLADPDVPVEDKQALVAALAAEFGFTRGNLLKANGDSWFDGNNYSERDYFQSAIRGTPYISDPTVSKVTGKISFLVSAPLWKGGQPDSAVIGVVYFVPDTDFLNQLVERINPSPNAYGYMINRQGTSVADPDRELVGVENSIEASKTDPSQTSVALLDQKMIRGEQGFGRHQYDGQSWVQSYAPVANTNGWSLGIMAPERDFMGSFYLAVQITVTITALFLVVGLAAAIIYSGQLRGRVAYCADRLAKLSEGDLRTPVKAPRQKDEIAGLQANTAKLVDSLRDIVEDISWLLGGIAAGNLNVAARRTYHGDFIPIQTATEKITDALNHAMMQIRTSSFSVEEGAEHISGNAQSLSQGATEQASSVGALAESLAQLNTQVRETAEIARTASVNVERTEKNVADSSQKMAQMILAMKDISTNSGEIGKIVKAIEDIAFQTNILALNAAVEAARAGEAGKGFAVVADEVRNLAAKSAEAANNTTALISQTIQSVESGTKIAGETATAMSDVVDNTRNVSGLIKKITQASGEQAEGIGQVTQGIEQISTVVQMNSAMSQESAAASEELNGQAQILKDLVSRFTLRGNG